MIQPIHFSEQQLSMFNTVVSSKDIVSIASDTYKTDSPLWVNFEILTNFAKLYLYYWNREQNANTPLAIEQRSLLLNMLFNITHAFNLANRHNCLFYQQVDLHKLLNITIATKIDNQYLAKYSHHEYDILEIEKLGLEHSKIELKYDTRDKAIIQDVIMFSKLMGLELHRHHIL